MARSSNHRGSRKTTMRLSHKRHDFRKKIVEIKMCVLIVDTSLSKSFYSKKDFERHYDKCAYVSM